LNRLNVFSGQIIGTLYESRPIHLGFHGATLWFVSIISSAVCGWYSKKYRRVKEPIMYVERAGLWAIIDDVPAASAS
jgi:hypothetical protein